MNRSRLDMNTAMASTATTRAVPRFGWGSVTSEAGDLVPCPMDDPSGVSSDSGRTVAPPGWVRPDIGLTALRLRHARTGAAPRLLNRAHARGGGREVGTAGRT